MKTNIKEKTLESIITKSKYSYVNRELTTAHFPKPKTIQTENWKIIRMDKSFTSQEALDEMKKQGCRPMNAWELAVWANEHRDELKTWEYAVAFGQMWVDSDGYHRVPGVDRRSDDVFEFRLGHFGSVWGVDGCLVCFCDPTLETKTTKLDSASLASLVLRIKNLEEKITKVTELAEEIINVVSKK